MTLEKMTLKTTVVGKQPLMEVDFQLKMTFDGSQTLMEDDIEERQPSMEEKH